MPSLASKSLRVSPRVWLSITSICVWAGTATSQIRKPDMLASLPNACSIAGTPPLSVLLIPASHDIKLAHGLKHLLAAKSTKHTCVDNQSPSFPGYRSMHSSLTVLGWQMQFENGNNGTKHSQLLAVAGVCCGASALSRRSLPRRGRKAHLAGPCHSCSIAAVFVSSAAHRHTSRLQS